MTIVTGINSTVVPWLLESGNVTVIPREIGFSEDNLISIITYSVLFLVSACGNLTVFVVLCCGEKGNGHLRVNLFVTHLTIADLIVTFIMMPTEIGWHVTVAWRAGDAACRALMFFRWVNLFKCFILA